MLRKIGVSIVDSVFHAPTPLLLLDLQVSEVHLSRWWRHYGGDRGVILASSFLAEFGPAGIVIGIGFNVGIRWCSDYIRKMEAEIGEMLPAT